MGKCEACNIDAPSLSDDEIKKLRPQIPSWSIIEVAAEETDLSKSKLIKLLDPTKLAKGGI